MWWVRFWLCFPPTLWVSRGRSLRRSTATGNFIGAVSLQWTTGPSRWQMLLSGSVSVSWDNGSIFLTWIGGCKLLQGRGRRKKADRVQHIVHTTLCEYVPHSATQKVRGVRLHDNTGLVGICTSPLKFVMQSNYQKNTWSGTLGPVLLCW